MAHIRLLDPCSRCSEWVEEKLVDDLCQKCLKEVRNKCENCGKKGQYNYGEKDYGVRCKSHILDGMVNLYSKEVCSKKFNERIEKIGGRVIGEYIGFNNPIDCICRKEHKCKPRPNNIREGKGMCRICVNNDPEVAKDNFYKIINELGGKVIGEYIGGKKPVDCICDKGHKCNPRPDNIQQKQGMCRICANKDPEVAKANFHKRIKELGGKVVGEYIASNTPVNCICENEHDCNPKPNTIQRGQGMCKKCKQSGGEVFISKVLKVLQLVFRTEVNNDKLKKKLRFDFYFEYQGKMYYLEFDGGQHFKYIPFFHNNNIDIFTQKQQIDIVKNQLC